MKKINEFLTVLIFILTAVLMAVVGLKAYDVYHTNRKLAKEQEEIELAQVFARNEEAQKRVQEMETEIQELIQDKEELERFIASIQNDVSADLLDSMVQGDAVVFADGTVTGNGTVSANDMPYGNGTVSANGMTYGNGTVTGNSIVLADGVFFEDGTVSANSTVSGNLPDLLRGSVSSDEINYYDGTMTNSSIFDAWRSIYEQPEGLTLAERRALRTSYEETLEVNQADRERIAESRRDFSGLKIACLGDSITAAANLEGEEGYQQYSYPSRLKELLGAGEVYNLGIGGSSIGRYWSDAYVDRYQEIPEDADIIIVMGGTNDGFCVSDKEFGSLEERTFRTFCGDLDELMGGLRENYPDADIFFVTPLPNILQDYLMSERNYLLPQQRFVDVILTLADEYDYEVIDLYNSNILDSHDANVVADYIPDGVHGNRDGYQIMAEHFAAEIIQYYADEESDAVSDNDIDGKSDTISGNDTDEESDAVSENDMDEESDAVSKNDVDEETRNRGKDEHRLHAVQ